LDARSTPESESVIAQSVLLVAVGVVVGASGTLVGAGGGFLLMPLLLLLYPGLSSELLTTISLAMVCGNAISGSIAYARMGRTDYKSGLIFAAAGVPGAVVGAIAIGYIPRRLFDGVFGVVLIAASIFLMLRPVLKTVNSDPPGSRTLRVITEADGTSHSYSYRVAVGVAMAMGIGFLSSLLGLGGGIIHVPAMVHFLNFPVHVATATSHLVLAIMTLAGTMVHVFTGAFAEGLDRIIPLTAGAIVGAQLGARLSRRVRGAWIIRCLAIALAMVGVRILILAFQ